MDKLPATMLKRTHLTTSNEGDGSCTQNNADEEDNTTARHCSQGSVSLVMFDALKMDGSGMSHQFQLSSGTNVFTGGANPAAPNRLSSNFFPLESQLSERRPSGATR